MILVGGMGTRLRPLTLSAPKPMLPTAGVPFLTHLITRIRDAASTTSCSARRTTPRSSSRTSATGRLGVEFEYVVEAEPLGTGGGIRNVAGGCVATTC